MSFWCMASVLVFLTAFTVISVGQQPPELLQAAANGRAAEIEALLKQGADPNVKDEMGQTALMLAAERGHTDIVRTLLANGADPNIENEIGEAAPCFAIRRGHGDIVRLLLEAETHFKTCKVDTYPILLSQPPEPSYPKKAKKDKKSGVVAVEILVRPDGRTEVVRILKSNPYFDDAATEHAKGYIWKPAVKDGKAVGHLGMLQVHFALPERKARPGSGADTGSSEGPRQRGRADPSE